MRGATRTRRQAVWRHRLAVVFATVALTAMGGAVTATAAPQATSSGGPTFGQPTISGIGGVGFSNGIVVDGNGVVYTHVPDTTTSKTTLVWKSTDNGRTFKWTSASAPLTGAFHPCLGGSDVDIAVD